MTRQEFIAGFTIWLVTVLFCQIACSAEVTAENYVTMHGAMPPVPQKNRLERAVDWTRAQGKKHRKIVWCCKTGVDIGLKVCQVVAAVKH